MLSKSLSKKTELRAWGDLLRFLMDMTIIEKTKLPNCFAAAIRYCAAAKELSTNSINSN